MTRWDNNNDKLPHGSKRLIGCHNPMASSHKSASLKSLKIQPANPARIGIVLSSYVTLRTLFQKRPRRLKQFGSKGDNDCTHLKEQMAGLAGDWGFMTDIEYERKKQERHELCTLVTGYLWGVLVKVVGSEQISANLQKKLETDLDYVRPIMARIWDLGEPKAAAEADDDDKTFEGKTNG